MNIMNQINSLQAAANGEFGALDEDNTLLDTAYIEVVDNREVEESQTVTTASAKSALSGISSARTAKLSESKKLKVQFNPASLDISAGGSSVKTRKGITKKKEKLITEINKPPKMDLSVKLIFDRTVYFDSSVMPEVEGFLAILKNPYTRQIRFYWGDLYYAGRLTSVNADYTMFNAFGIPVRADVTLRMEIQR